jgi:hypothetical protein
VNSSYSEETLSTERLILYRLQVMYNTFRRGEERREEERKRRLAEE